MTLVPSTKILKSSRHLATVAAGILSFFILFQPSAPGKSPKSLFESGVECQKKLEKSPKLKKFRHNWENCIRPFEKLLIAFPQTPYFDDSLSQLGSLYSGFYKYSLNPATIEKSIDYYHQLTQDFPNTSLAKKAQRSLLRLNKSAPAAEISNIRFWAYSDYTRLVLDINRSVPYKTTTSKKKGMLIRLDPARLSKKAKSKLDSLDKGLLRLVDIQQIGSNLVLVKISTKNLSQAPKILSLRNPNRLVLDLYPASGKNKDSSLGNSSGLKAEAYSFKINTIILDPGHGGKDPGAIGRTGLTEKEIVLDIAFRLRKLIQGNLGKKVIMTRNRDQFISLEKRTQIANSKKADLFISIHANSHPQKTTRGIEIYHLGQSSDKRARVVAARENNVSIEALGSLDQSVKQILFDLGREYNSTQSQDLAYFTHQSFQDTLKNQFKYRLIDLGVKRAPFYVLLNSNMPSILAEVSFISNPTEEKLLRQTKYRQAIAESLFQGIQRYIQKIEPTS